MSGPNRRRRRSPSPGADQTFSRLEEALTLTGPFSGRLNEAFLVDDNGHRIRAVASRIGCPLVSGNAFEANPAGIVSLSTISDAFRMLPHGQGDEGKQNRVRYASGASGGDLLFHEVCEELKVPRLLCLPLPADIFRNQAV